MENGELRKLPIGIQDFEKIREGDYLYVDKTELIYRLVNSGCYYFLSRPRRFGKSLLMSTLHAYFSGRKELFEGLAMEELEKDWIEYPVLHLDLNTQKYDCLEALENILEEFIIEQESIYGRNPAEKELGRRFQGIIRRASEGRIDMVVKTPKFCYVLEFKLDGTAEEALAQISDKNYTLPFAIEDQRIVRIGINFDSKTRNIDKCLVG